MAVQDCFGNFGVQLHKLGINPTWVFPSNKVAVRPKNSRVNTLIKIDLGGKGGTDPLDPPLYPPVKRYIKYSSLLENSSS